MRRSILAIAATMTLVVSAAQITSAAGDQMNVVLPKANTEHATPAAADFLRSYFTAKSRRNVEDTVGHFSEEKLTYIDAPLGWLRESYQAQKEVFSRLMPNWPATGRSYPTRILGDENSAVVLFANTPDLFGSEIRAMAAVDMENGKVVRWVDYWDGRHFGAERAAQMRTPADRFPTDFRETSVRGAASARIDETARKLQAALADGNGTAAAALFSPDAVYEDRTLRTQIVGRIAIARYLNRALDRLPYGVGGSVAHVLGNDLGGGYEWRAAPAYRESVRRGITALELGGDGTIERLTTVWDGSVVAEAELGKLVLLSME